MGVGYQGGSLIGADRTRRLSPPSGPITLKKSCARPPRPYHPGGSGRVTPLAVTSADRLSARVVARQGTRVSGVVPAFRVAASVAMACAFMWTAVMARDLGGRAFAQESALDVAYVEAIAGHAVASSHGTTAELDILDPLNDGMHLDLERDAVLRLCHYRTHRLLTLKGPLRASISTAGVIAEDGSTVAGSGEVCAAPVISTFQGGVALRGLAAATPVALRPRIRIINRGAQPIKKAILWDLRQRTAVATFGRTMAQPQLTDGQTYSLVVAFTDGTEWKATFRASTATETSTVIVVLR